MIQRLRLFGPASALCAALFLALPGAPALAETKISSDDDKAAYGVGFAIGKGVQEQLSGLELSKKEMAFAIAAVQDALTDADPKTDIDAALKIFQAKMAVKAKEAEAAAKKAAEKQTAENAKVLKKEAAAKGAQKLDSGMIYTELSAGSGDAPGADKSVEVHYVGKLTDGTVFDSSRARGAPAVFPLNGVIPCFREGIQKMKPGGKAKLVCPPDLAYGERGAPPSIPPVAVLFFEVELLSVK